MVCARHRGEASGKSSLILKQCDLCFWNGELCSQVLSKVTPNLTNKVTEAEHLEPYIQDSCLHSGLLEPQWAQLGIDIVGSIQLHLIQWFSRQFCTPRGHVAMSGDKFLLSCLGKRCYWHLLGRGQNCCKHPPAVPLVTLKYR